MTTPEGADPVAVEGRYAMTMLNEWRLAEIRRRRAERSATVEREADREIADLLGHADALAAEVERLRAANEALAGACRSAANNLEILSSKAWDFGASYLAANLSELTNRLDAAEDAHAAAADAGPGAGEG